MEKLDIFKRERGAEDYLEADMWCQFGTATIRAPDEGTMHFSDCLLTLFSVERNVKSE